MRKIVIKTFPGCPAGEKIVKTLHTYKDKEGFELQVETVPSADLAEERGLYGSPTIVVNGVEFQQERRGSSGFY